MAKKFNELRQKMSDGRKRRNKAGADRLLLDMSLKDLRQMASNLNQEDVAQILDVTQGYISKLERQDDMLLSKLYAYVQALGGEVEIKARVAGQEVAIREFREVSKLKAAFAASGGEADGVRSSGV